MPVCGVGCGFRPGICCWWRCRESCAAARASPIWSNLPEATAGGCSACIAQVTLYLGGLGVAISQACCSTGQNHELAMLKKLLVELNLDVLLVQSDAPHTQKPFFGSSRFRRPTSRHWCARCAPCSRSSARSPSWLRIRDQSRPQHHLDASGHSRRLPRSTRGTGAYP